MEWVNRWNTWIAAEPTLPGVWKCRDGGHLVRGRIVCEKTGKPVEFRKVYPEVNSAMEAVKLLQEGLEVKRTGRPKVESLIPRLKDFAVCLVEEKVSVHTDDNRGFKSIATRHKWKTVLLKHIFPRFGDMYLDKIDGTDIRAWQLDMGKAITAGKLSPRTANDRMGTLRTIINEAVIRYKLPFNPMAGIRNFSKAEHPTYTEEEPNALTPEEVSRFLSSAQLLVPRHFAFFVIGFATGLRPSSIRPLRWKGPESDIVWDKKVILVRRSHTLGQTFMNCPKNAKGQRIGVPQEILNILKWHGETQLTDKERSTSDLLFPGKHGFVSRQTIYRIIPDILRHAGITKHITQRAWRRTFNDLARLASMDHLVLRSISGHSSESMTELYSTVYGAEQRAGLARIAEIGGIRQAIDGGMQGGMHTNEPVECAVKPSSIVN